MTTSSAGNENPVWSHDGSKMVFEFHPNYENDDLYVLDVPAASAIVGVVSE